MMKICKKQIACLFFKYNEDYFGGILPEPNFKIMHSVNTLGYFSYVIDGEFGPMETIEISDFYAYTPKQLRNLMVHEMIHYYLYYTDEDVRLKHGKEFKKMARQLNKTYGLHVTPTFDISKMKPHPNASYLRKLIYKLVS